MALDHSLRGAGRGIQGGRTDRERDDESGSDADETYPTSGWLMQCLSNVAPFSNHA
jgi:hypothetical protein